jgi:cytochrome P450
MRTVAEPYTVDGFEFKMG